MLKDEIVIDDAGKAMNTVPSARGADESARGCLITQPSLCQQVRFPSHSVSRILYGSHYIFTPQWSVPWSSLRSPLF